MLADTRASLVRDNRGEPRLDGLEERLDHRKVGRGGRTVFRDLMLRSKLEVSLAGVVEVQKEERVGRPGEEGLEAKEVGDKDFQ